MPMRSIHGAALVFAATLAATVGSPGPAEAFLPLPIPIPMLQQSQPPVESRSGRSPSDNNFRRGSDRGKYESAPPVKPSTGTRSAKFLLLPEAGQKGNSHMLMMDKNN